MSAKCGGITKQQGVYCSLCVIYSVIQFVGGFARRTNVQLILNGGCREVLLHCASQI